MSLLAALINAADYPLYRVDVTLSNGQTFTYQMVFNSGLPQSADDNCVMECAKTIKHMDWGTPAGNPPGTTATSVIVTRGIEQTSQRTSP
jgi:hypothetical protein